METICPHQRHSRLNFQSSTAVDETQPSRAHYKMLKSLLVQQFPQISVTQLSTRRTQGISLSLTRKQCSRSMVFSPLRKAELTAQNGPSEVWTLSFCFPPPPLFFPVLFMTEVEVNLGRPQLKAAFHILTHQFRLSLLCRCSFLKKNILSAH